MQRFPSALCPDTCLASRAASVPVGQEGAPGTGLGLKEQFCGAADSAVSAVPALRRGAGVVGARGPGQAPRLVLTGRLLREL